MMTYPSDITQEQFDLISDILEGARKKTKPMEHKLLDIFNGILYVLKGGIQWRMLPTDFPKWQSVYYHFRNWKKPGKDGRSALDQALDKLVVLERNNAGKKDHPTLGIVDAKSVQNTFLPNTKGYDAGKKVSGIKIHLCCDTLGLPAGISITAANTTDRAGAIDLIGQQRIQMSDITKYLVDGGYTGAKFAAAVKDINGAEVEVVKRNELHTFKVLPKRWIVERCFAWVDMKRRLWKNCERLTETTLAMVQLVFISNILRHY